MSNRSHVLTDTQIHAIRRLRALGASKSVIAAAVGVVEQTVSYHCAKPGKVVPADRRERQRGVKYKPRKTSALDGALASIEKAQAITASLEPVSLDEARQALGMSTNDSARQMMARVAHSMPPKRGFLARIFGT